MTLTPFTATMIAEGVDEPEGETEEERCENYYAAWQYLVDTDIVWKLQGWYGRVAANMIEKGLITKAQS